jgi:predicted RNase H-like HicB family nuclease
MDKAKQAALEAAGWRFGTVAEFLGLTNQEKKMVEGKQPVTVDVLVRLQAVAVPEPSGAYSIFVPALPGCCSDALSIEDVQKNVIEAAEAWLAAEHDRAKDDIPDRAFLAFPDRKFMLGLVLGWLSGHDISVCSDRLIIESPVTGELWSIRLAHEAPALGQAKD